MNPAARPGAGGGEQGDGLEGLEVLHGVVRRVTFHHPDTRYTVLRVELDGQEGRVATAVGYFGPPPAGETIRAFGRWRLHPAYGRQFEVQALHTVTPATAEGIERFLACGAIKGIGPATARRLVEAFGERTLDVLAADPQAVAARVQGLGLRRARAIAEYLQDQRLRHETLAFLHGLGLGPGMARRLLQRYGVQAAEVARRSPYRLALEVPGFGFRRADEVARRFGVGTDDPERLQAALWHALLEGVEQGHVYLPAGQLLAAARALLSPGASAPLPPPDDGGGDRLVALLERALGALASQGRVVVEGQAVYPAWLHRLEQELADRLLALACRPPARRWLPEQLQGELARAEQALGVKLAVEQREAVLRALEDGVLVVTGGPGTGKTTLVRFVAYLASRAGWRTALAAPTGRAAQRLNEAVLGPGPAWPGVLPARTIHRLLEPRARSTPSDPEQAPGEGRLVFHRNEQHPLDADILIVDEVSMLDTVLACHLLRAVGPATRLVLVGDVHQLPSVGPGQVLRDVIQSGAVGVVRLRHIFRQAARSAIVRGAHQVLLGRSVVRAAPARPRSEAADAATADGLAAGPGARSQAKPAPEGELRFVEAETQEVSGRIRDLVAVEIPARYGFDPLRDIQVLAATHQGPAGCEALNELLQEALNPAGPGRPELVVGRRRLRAGDRVLQVRNDYQAPVRLPQAAPGAAGEPTPAEEAGVFNGEIGRIREVDPAQGSLVVVFDDGREVDYTEERLHQLQLAYAITVHKSQGNEFPCVVIPVVWTMPALMNRHLLYTAITRGRRLVVLVGQRRAVAAHVRNASGALRHTGLARRLMEGLRPASARCL